MMKVAIPARNGNVDNHFGHCESFRIYELDDSKNILAESSMKSPESCGCKSDLASDLAKEGVNLMLAGGIGQGAINKLQLAGIQVLAGFSGSLESALNQWRSGFYRTEIDVCNHHDGCNH